MHVRGNQALFLSLSFSLPTPLSERKEGGREGGREGRKEARKQGRKEGRIIINMS